MCSARERPSKAPSAVIASSYTSHKLCKQRETKTEKQKKMGKKNRKKSKELPSFLTSLPQRGKEILPLPLHKPTVKLTGPIFFGGCRQYHPTPHSDEPFSFSSNFLAADPKENLWKTLFMEVKPFAEECSPRKPFRLVKEPPPFLDLWPHRAPGKLFEVRHGLHFSKPNLGRTKSEIKGETIREILCQKAVDPFLRHALSNQYIKEYSNSKLGF